MTAVRMTLCRHHLMMRDFVADSLGKSKSDGLCYMLDSWIADRIQSGEIPPYRIGLNFDEVVLLFKHVRKPEDPFLQSLLNGRCVIADGGLIKENEQ